jgi:hypothetical protein
MPQSGLQYIEGLTADALKCFGDLTATSGASKATVLQTNVSELRQLIDYLRTDGNTGDAETITGEEIDAYIAAYLETGAGQALHMSAQECRDVTVANLSSYLAVVDYAGGGSPETPPVDPKADPLWAAVGTYQTVQQMYAGLAGSEENGARSAAPEEVPEGGILAGALTEANLGRFYANHRLDGRPAGPGHAAASKRR